MPANASSAAGAARRRDFWRRGIRRILLLLALWFLAGPVLGILLVERLNALEIGGMPVGFWISQQGAIYVFVGLIFLYAFLSERSDREEGDGEGSGAYGVAPVGSSRDETGRRAGEA